MAKVIADENVPGLCAADEPVVAEVRIGSWKFQKLADGCVFASEWRGAPDNEVMVSHLLLSPADVQVLSGLLKAKG